MGKRLVIKGASFINIVDSEAAYKEVTYNSENIEFLGNKTTLGLGGMAIASVPYWTTIISNQQLGMHFPIAVDGATEIVIKNSYGQSNGVHARFLAEDGSWLADVTGGSSQTDASITPTIPSNAKWLLVNFEGSGYEVTVKGYMTSPSNTITPTVNTEGAFISSSGNITASTLTPLYDIQRAVYDINVSGKSVIYVNGYYAAEGVQGFTQAVFFDLSNNKVGDAVTYEASVNHAGFVKLTVPPGAVKVSVNGFKGFPPLVKY